MSDVLTVEDYLKKAGINAEKIYTKDQAVQLINEHTISIYQGRINLKEDTVYTGMDIAEKLHVINRTFSENFEKAFAKEFEEEK